MAAPRAAAQNYFLNEDKRAQSLASVTSGLEPALGCSEASVCSPAGRGCGHCPCRGGRRRGCRAGVSESPCRGQRARRGWLPHWAPGTLPRAQHPLGCVCTSLKGLASLGCFSSGSALPCLLLLNHPKNRFDVSIFLKLKMELSLFVWTPVLT